MSPPALRPPAPHNQGSPPGTTFPPFPGCFSPTPAGGRSPLPLSRPLLNDSIYRPPILARKEIYIFFFQTLAPVCVGFCGWMASERGWGQGAGGQGLAYRAGGQRPVACSRFFNQGPGLGWAGRPGGRAVRVPPASSLWRTLPRRLGRPQKKTCLLIKMGPFLNLSPCGSGHSLPPAGPAY